MNANDILREKILEKANFNKDIYQEVDGFYVYGPTVFRGFMQSYHLRIIADELDRRNEPWQQHLDHYLSDQIEFDFVEDLDKYIP